jgi:hypothetical protein
LTPPRRRVTANAVKRSLERRQAQSLAEEQLGCGKRLDDAALGALQEGFGNER